MALGTSHAAPRLHTAPLTVSGKRYDHIFELRFNHEWPTKLVWLWNACNSAKMLQEALDDELRADRLALASVDLDLEVLEARAAHILADTEAHALPFFVRFYQQRGDMWQ